MDTSLKSAWGWEVSEKISLERNQKQLSFLLVLLVNSTLFKEHCQCKRSNPTEARLPPTFFGEDSQPDLKSRISCRNSISPSQLLKSWQILGTCRAGFYTLHFLVYTNLIIIRQLGVSKRDDLPFVVGTAPSVSDIVSSGNYFLVEEFQSVTIQRSCVIQHMLVG